MAFIYNKGFHTLMKEAGILSAESFSSYITDVIGFNEEQAYNVDGFEWDLYSSITFDFQQIMLTNRVKVMATYVDKDSETIPLGTEGFEMTRGVIPCMKARYIWDSDDYRRYLDAVSKLQFQDITVKEYALNLLFNGMTDIKNAHELSMTYQRDQMVSNRKLQLDATNNPRGIVGLIFESGVPSANVTTKTGNARWWTSATEKIATNEGSSATPVQDVKDIVRSMKRQGYEDIILEVDYISWLEDMDHSAWRTEMGYLVRPELWDVANSAATALTLGKRVEDDQLKSMFARIIGIPAENVHFRKGVTGVERLKGKGPDAKLERVKMRTFNANTYVFYPAGPLGTIKTALALTPDDSAIYAKFFGDRGLIQYEYDKKARIQDWWSELYALCVPTRPKEMYYLITYSAS